MNTQKNVMVEVSTLTRCVHEKLLVTIFVINGFQMKGIITEFDDHTVYLIPAICSAHDDKPRLIYKRAISTIVLPESDKAES